MLDRAHSGCNRNIVIMNVTVASTIHLFMLWGLRLDAIAYVVAMPSNAIATKTINVA
jgi:hypothetical protein